MLKQKTLNARLAMPTGAEFCAAFNPRRNFRALFEVQGQYIQSLDGWRALARVWVGMGQSQIIIGWVLSSHGENLEGLSRDHRFILFFGGNFGVDLLFVLSGFLIGGILIRERLKTSTIDFGRFYFRRAMRILPLYFLVMILLKLGVACGTLPAAFGFVGSFLPNVLYLNNFFPIRSQFMPWTWSLAIEEQFYLLCPLLIFYSGRSLRHFPLLSVLLFIFFKAVHFYIIRHSGISNFWVEFPHSDAQFSYDDLVYTNSFVRFSAILIGVFAAYAYELKLDRILFKSKPAMILALTAASGAVGYVLLGMNYSISEPKRDLFELFHRELFAAGIAIMILAGIRLKALDRLLSLRIFMPISRLSYGVYLVNIGVITLFLTKAAAFFNPAIFERVDYLRPFHVLEFATVTFMVSVMIAGALHLLIEKPFMNLRNSFKFAESGGA